MSVHERAQSDAAPPQPRARALHAADGGVDVLRASGLRRKLGNPHRQKFYQMVRAGRFRHLEASPEVCDLLGRVVYSVRKVEAWIDAVGPAMRLAKRA